MENFGCRATQADGAAIERDLLQRGIQRSATPSSAEVAVLNTCTVTAAADSDARATIRRIHRENPDCKIMVTGCYAQRVPEEIASLPGVIWVVGNSHKSQVAEIAAGGVKHKAISSQHSAIGNQHSVSAGGVESFDVASFHEVVIPSGPVSPTRSRVGVGMSEESAFAGLFETQHFEIAQQSTNFISLGQLSGLDHLPESNLTLVGDIFAHTELMAAPVFESGTSSTKTRPNLKVQDGCDNRCSFCIIPFVRGHSRSLKLEAVLHEVDSLVAAGYREIVISGINLGRWGRDYSPQQRFEDLVAAILDKTAIERLRISSVEPMDWSNELIALVASSPRICKHAHVPLQSGSDRVLRAMHRKYRPWHYADRIQRIRASMPDAAIGADVMVGFPGETDELFEESRRFIAEMPFTYLHVFTYSSRPGTAAAAMPDHVLVPIAKERNRILRDLIAEKNLAFRQSFIGKTLEAITLHPREDGTTEALTNNFIKLRLEENLESNQIVVANIYDTTFDGLTGAIMSQHPPAMV